MRRGAACSIVFGIIQAFCFIEIFPGICIYHIGYTHYKQNLKAYPVMIYSPPHKFHAKRLSVMFLRGYNCPVHPLPITHRTGGK
jgi:hypothetical protein